MSNTQTVEKVEQEIKVGEPKLFKVLLHNDDKTTMEFVIQVLRQIYHKNYDTAVELMMLIHNQGYAAIEIYTKEIAEQKVIETIAAARANGFPLVASCEEA